MLLTPAQPNKQNTTRREGEGEGVANGLIDAVLPIPAESELRFAKSGEHLCPTHAANGSSLTLGGEGYALPGEPGRVL